jgi:hypothetical protein
MGNTLSGGEKQAPSTVKPLVSPRMSLDQQISGPGAQGIARKLGLVASALAAGIGAGAGGFGIQYLLLRRGKAGVVSSWIFPYRSSARCSASWSETSR